MRRTYALILTTWISNGFPAGCHQPTPSATYRTTWPNRDAAREAAREANERGLKLASEGKYEEAEEAFREALTADVSFAAAHNNLGIVLAARSRYYEAAMEFAIAGRLGHGSTAASENLERLFNASDVYVATRIANAASR